MKEPRIYVDFNEMIEKNLVLLYKTDIKKDSYGNIVEFKEEMKIKFSCMIQIRIIKRTI